MHDRRLAEGPSQAQWTGRGPSPAAGPATPYESTPAEAAVVGRASSIWAPPTGVEGEGTAASRSAEGPHQVPLSGSVGHLCEGQSMVKILAQQDDYPDDYHGWSRKRKIFWRKKHGRE